MSTQQQVLFTKPTNISIAVASNTSPYIHAYPWSSGTGFGTKYANPSSLPTNGRGITFSHNVDVISVGIHVYAWDVINGFGTKYATPASPPSTTPGYISFSRNDDSIAMASAVSGGMHAYPWNVSTGFGTRYTNPGTMPVFPISVFFSPTQDVIFISSNDTPYIHAYAWDSVNGFGTKYANPATLPSLNCRGIAVSSDGNYVAITSQISPRIQVYPWNISTGFGTKYANPVTAAQGSSQAECVVFHPDIDAIAFITDANIGVAVYKWSGSGFGTKYADPAGGLVAPTTNPSYVAFSPDGNAIAHGGPSGSSVHAYAWDSVNGFGTKYANPATLPAGIGFGVTFSNVY